MLKIIFFITFSISLSSALAQTPLNDVCSDAIELTVGQEFVGATNIVNSSNCTASGELPYPSCSQFGGGEDIWFFVTVPDSGEFTIETAYYNDLTDTALSIYEGTCGALIEVICDDDSGDNYMSLAHLSGRTPGEILYIRLFDYQNNDFGSFLIAAYDSSQPTCDSPTNLTEYFLSETSVMLFWDDQAGADSWEIQVIHQGDLPANTGVLISENPYSVTDLESHVTYEFYVRAVCNDGGFSYWSAPHSFTISFPENDEPENAISINCGETIFGDTTYASITDGIEDCDEYPNNPSTSPGIWYTLVGDGNLIELSTCNQASFDTSIGVYTGDTDALVCDSATDDSEDCNGYTTVHSFFSMTDTVYYIRVYGYAESSIGTFNLTTTCLNPCVPPTDIEVTISNDTSASLSWNPGNTESSWNIEWGDAEFNLGEGTQLNNYASNSILLSGLNLYDAYDFYIQSICFGTGLGEWFGPYTWTQTQQEIRMHEGTASLCENTLFTDSGGVVSHYPNNEEQVFIAYPDDLGSKLQVEFIDFNCGNEGSGGDFLAVFDGEDDGGAMLVSSANVGDDGMLNTFQATNDLGALTFIFDANSTETHEGWKAVLSCYSTISIKENDCVHFQIYPNPTETTFWISATENITKYSLTSVLGQNMITDYPDRKNIQVSVANIMPGTYMLEIWIADKIGHRKLVIK